jgi:hypothetical protein
MVTRDNTQLARESANYQRIIVEQFHRVELAPVLRLLNIAEERTQRESFEKETLAEAVAYIIESPHTPASMRTALQAHVTEQFERAKLHDPTDPHTIRDMFALTLKKEADGKEGGRDEAP